MAAPSDTPSSLADTIDASPGASPFDSSELDLHASARKRVALVEGSSLGATAETRALLRRRLRLMATVLAGGFLAFLVWRLFATPPKGATTTILYGHVAVTALLVFAVRKLCPSCDLSLKELRIAEAMIVGGPAIFFAWLSYERLENAAAMADRYAHVPLISGAWVLLIFSYALFIPNAWRRAAAVIGVLALAPVVELGVLYFRSPAFAELITVGPFAGVFVETALTMGFTAVTAVMGVHTIGTLRYEAFVARQLGQYRLKQLLGAGGMGEVYLAEHEMMKRPCAIKIIRPEKAGDPLVLARFEREVRATAKLSHWNSIDIYDYGRTDDGTFYYVMEFLPGHNVGELVDHHGPLPAERLVHLMRQVCDALAEAHDYGLVHRDIKPANVFCAYRGGIFDVAKLLDFGLVKPTDQAENIEHTQGGGLTGSPLFMAPEQATGSPDVDERSDIYSLGALMYFMATGQVPFNYDRPLQVMVAHASEQPTTPRSHRPELPDELEAIILRCLEKDPDDRFQSVAELRVALEQTPVAAPWTNDQAAQWWRDYGCPKRRAMAEQARELAAV